MCPMDRKATRWAANVERNVPALGAERQAPRAGRSGGSRIRSPYRVAGRAYGAVFRGMGTASGPSGGAGDGRGLTLPLLIEDMLW